MKQIFSLLLFISLSNVLSGQNPVDLKYRIQCIEGDTIEDASCDVCPPEQGKPFWGARIEDPFGRSKYIQQPYTPVQRGNYVIVTYSVDSSTFIPVDFAELTTAQAIIDTLNKCPFPPSDSVGLITRFEMTQDSNVVISIRQPDGKDKADTADLRPAFDDTDKQLLDLSGDVLSIDRGNSIDLSPYLDNTDNQILDTLTFDSGSSILTASIERDGVPALEVNLSSLLDNTDNQNLTGATLTGTTLQIQIEDGTSASVDLSSLQDGTGTDDQILSINGNTLNLEDGGVGVDLTPYLDNTDDQQVDTFVLNGNEILLSIEGDGEPAKVIDLSQYISTDDQNLTGATLTGTTLQVDIENGTSASVDLASLQDGTGTDDQQISLVGNSLSLEDGGAAIDLSPYLDNTDGQTLSLTGLDLSISNGNTVTLPDATIVQAQNGVNASTTGNTATVKLGGTLTENTSIPTTTSYNLDIATGFAEGSIGTRWNTTREGLDGFRAGAASSGAYSLWGWDSTTGAAESITRVENSLGTEKSQLRLTETFGRFSFESGNFLAVNPTNIALWATNGTDESDIDLFAHDNITLDGGGQVDLLAGGQSKMRAPSIRLEVPAGSGGAGIVFSGDLLTLETPDIQVEETLGIQSNPQQIMTLHPQNPPSGYLDAGREYWGAMPLIEIQTEEGGPTTLLNPLDTFLLRLFTTNPGGGSGGLWTLGGSNEALYQAGDVQVDKDLRVKGIGSEYREQSTTVVKNVPNSKPIKYLTYITVQEVNSGHPANLIDRTSFDVIPGAGGDPDTYEEVFFDYDTLNYNMKVTTDAAFWLGQYFNVENENILPIWERDVKTNEEPGIPATVTYDYQFTGVSDTTLLTPDTIPYYIFLDSTLNADQVIVQTPDTATYAPGYYRYTTFAEVDSMIAQATQGALNEVSITDLYINEPFQGFGFFDDLEPGAFSAWGNLAGTAMLNFEEFAFGSKAWLTVRGTPARPVTFRGLDENLNQMVEMRSEPDGGVLELFNTAGSGLIKLDAGGRSIIGPATFRNDQYGIMVDNITTTETARLTGIEVGTPGFAGGDIVSYDVTAWINEFGEAHFSKVTASDFVSTMKPDSSYQMEVLGESSVRMARFLQDSTDNSTLSLFNGAGTETVSLRAGSQSRFSEGVALGEYNTSPYTGVLAHIKEDDRVGAPQWSYPDNFALVVEDQSDDAEISLYSPNGSSILFSDDADQYAGRIRWDNSADELSIEIGGDEKLSITATGPYTDDGNYYTVRSGSLGSPLFKGFSGYGGRIVDITSDALGGGQIDLYMFDSTHNVRIPTNPGVSGWINAYRFGIGTTSPESEFHVSDGNILVSRPSGSFSNAQLTVRHDDASGSLTFAQNSSGNGIFDNQGGSQLFYAGPSGGHFFYTDPGTGDEERIRIMPDGKVGIGGVTPSEMLHLNDGNLLVSRFGPGNRATISLSHADATGDVNIQQDAVGNAIFDNAAGSNLHYVNSGIHQFNVGGSEYMRVDNSGLIGINETNPAARLHVGGNESIRIGDNTDYMQFTDGSIQSKIEKTAPNQAYIDFNALPGDGTSPGTMRFFRETNTTGNVQIEIKAGNGTNSTQSVLGGNRSTYLNSISGNVGIGHNSPTEKLHVIGNTILDGQVKFDVGRGLVSWEENANDNADGAGVTLRTTSNPGGSSGSGSIFAVRSSGQAARLWVGQNVTSAGTNDFAVGTPTVGSEANAGLYRIFMDASEGSIKADYFRFAPQTAPTGAEGNVYYDSTDDELKVHDGTGYQSVGGGKQLLYSFFNSDDTQDFYLANNDYLSLSQSDPNQESGNEDEKVYYNWEGTEMVIKFATENSSYSSGTVNIELYRDTDRDMTTPTLVDSWQVDGLPSATNKELTFTATITPHEFYILQIDGNTGSSGDTFVYQVQVYK